MAVAATRCGKSWEQTHLLGTGCRLERAQRNPKIGPLILEQHQSSRPAKIRWKTMIRWSKIRWYSDRFIIFYPTCPLHFKRFIIFTGMQAGSFRSLAQRLALPSYGLSWPRGLPRSQWPSSLKAWWRSFCWMTFQVWNHGRWSRFSDCLGIYETYISICDIWV